MEKAIKSFPTEERVVMGADLNGHVGEDNNGTERIHGGHGCKRINRDGERVVHLAVPFGLMITSTLFSKSEEHTITYKSGTNAHQVDYIM